MPSSLQDKWSAIVSAAKASKTKKAQATYSIDPEILDAFKKICTNKNINMSQVIEMAIVEFVQAQAPKFTTVSHAPKKLG